MSLIVDIICGAPLLMLCLYAAKNTLKPFQGPSEKTKAILENIREYPDDWNKREVARPGYNYTTTEYYNDLIDIKFHMDEYTPHSQKLLTAAIDRWEADRIRNAALNAVLKDSER